MMMKLHPGAGIVLPWGPDCSPQVMTAITTSPELCRSRINIIIYHQESLTMQTSPLPQFQPNTLSVPQGWAEMHTLPLSLQDLCPVHTAPFSALHHSISSLGVLG
jgi:hypothetical protein